MADCIHHHLPECRADPRRGPQPFRPRSGIGLPHHPYVRQGRGNTGPVRSSLCRTLLLPCRPWQERPDKGIDRFGQRRREQKDGGAATNHHVHPKGPLFARALGRTDERLNRVRPNGLQGRMGPGGSAGVQFDIRAETQRRREAARNVKGPDTPCPGSSGASPPAVPLCASAPLREPISRHPPRHA